MRLPHAPRGDRLTVCVLGTEAHLGEAKALTIDGLVSRVSEIAHADVSTCDTVLHLQVCAPFHDATTFPDHRASQSVDDLKKMNKNKKLVKKMAKKYDVFLASQALIKQIPRLLGPGLNRAGKFPTPINPGETIAEKVDEARHLLKFALKKVLCLNSAVANVQMSKEEVVRNIVTALNFLVSLLKKNWQNIGPCYIKGTMTPSYQIYF